MRGASVDLWGPEDLSRATAAQRVGDSEHHGAHLPVAGVVPSTANERVVLVSMVLVLLVFTLVRGPSQPTGARAPPFLLSVT